MENLNKLVQEKLAEMEAKERAVRENLQYLKNNKKPLRNPAQREFPPKEQPKRVPELLPQGDVITPEEVIPEMQSYIQAYLKMPAENISKINEILPITSSERITMIYCLIAQTLKEINQLTKLKFSENLTEEERRLMPVLKEEEQIKLEYLYSCLSSAEKKEQEEKQKNTIVLVPALLAKDNLNSNDSKELYSEILGLIWSIENGTFRRMKRFYRGSNNDMNGALEVRGTKIRIVFKQIGPSAYAIFAIFIKKISSRSRNGKYKDYLRNRMREYENEYAQYLKSALNDETFLQQQQELFGSFCEMLDTKDSDGIKRLVRK